MKFKKIFAILLILAVFAPFSAFGATVKVGESYSFKEDEVIRDNFYIGAGEVFSNGDVFGDLIIGAGNITVSGNVSGDATVAGSDISVLEKVNGDLRIVGGDILVTEAVGGDLVVIGGNIKVLSSASVGNDLVILGGKIVVQGDVNGKVRIIGGEVNIDSKIKGNVNVKASDGIIIGDNAVIGGDLVYGGKDKSIIKINEKAVISGETIFKASKVNPAFSGRFALPAFFGVFALIKLIAILTAVALAAIFLNKFSNRVAKDAVTHLGKKTLWGFIALIIIPAAIAVFFASVFGAALGVLGIFGYIMLLILGTIYSGAIFGAWMDKLIRKKEEVTVDWKNGVLGVMALTLIIQIPFIGGLAGLFFFLLALGSISTIAYDNLWVKRK